MLPYAAISDGVNLHVVCRIIERRVQMDISGNNIVASVWFADAFNDLASAYVAGTVTIFEAIEEANQRLRVRLRSDLGRRGLRKLLQRDEDILQRFWERLLTGKIIESYDPVRGTPWPMIYRLFRLTAWDISIGSDKLSVGDLVGDACDPNSDAGIRRIDDVDLIEAVKRKYLKLSSKARAAVSRVHPLLASTHDEASDTGSNESVDRHRAFRRLREKLDSKAN